MIDFLNIFGSMINSKVVPISALHSVIFCGKSAEALSNRIDDCMLTFYVCISFYIQFIQLSALYW